MVPPCACIHKVLKRKRPRASQTESSIGRESARSKTRTSKANERDAAYRHNARPFEIAYTLIDKMNNPLDRSISSWSGTLPHLNIPKQIREEK
jgi:hypothetical protein